MCVDLANPNGCQGGVLYACFIYTCKRWWDKTMQMQYPNKICVHCRMISYCMFLIACLCCKSLSASCFSVLMETQFGLLLWVGRWSYHEGWLLNNEVWQNTTAAHEPSWLLRSHPHNDIWCHWWQIKTWISWTSSTVSDCCSLLQ